jgi:hypothetical protein
MSNLTVLYHNNNFKKNSSLVDIDADPIEPIV